MYYLKFLKKIKLYISICSVSCISNICILIMQTSFFVNMFFLLCFPQFCIIVLLCVDLENNFTL